MFIMSSGYLTQTKAKKINNSHDFFITYEQTQIVDEPVRVSKVPISTSFSTPVLTNVFPQLLLQNIGQLTDLCQD